jgi:hypothetical protein
LTVPVSGFFTDPPLTDWPPTLVTAIDGVAARVGPASSRAAATAARPRIVRLGRVIARSAWIWRDMAGPPPVRFVVRCADKPSGAAETGRAALEETAGRAAARVVRGLGMPAGSGNDVITPLPERRAFAIATRLLR